MSSMTFSELRNKIRKEKKRNWNFLMGNGFSIAYGPKIFSYNVLQNFVQEQNDEDLNKLFSIFKTTNFELIIRQLDITIKLAEEFSNDDNFINKITLNSNKLKVSLIDAIRKLHPKHVFEVEEEKSRSCSEFFSTIISSGGELFTTNYDILMYWILLRNQIPNISDGFGRYAIIDDEEYKDDTEYSELIWGKHKDEQNIHYLHGALPFFDTGETIIKEEYDGEYLLKNIERRIENNHYPIFVAAGSGDDKLVQIKHNSYLSYCYDKLSTITGSLITYGFNFGEYDDHIIEAINYASQLRDGNKLYSIYIGVFSDDDLKHIESIRHKFKCKVNIFDSRTADIWKND